VENASRIFVISDLHLGGDAPTMMLRPEALAAFIDALPEDHRDSKSLELLIAGDFVDFPAIPRTGGVDAGSHGGGDQAEDADRAAFHDIYAHLSL
jgi:UDP-2,3-diacylglucosamine pyrophosphatase LpxH